MLGLCLRLLLLQLRLLLLRSTNLPKSGDFKVDARGREAAVLVIVDVLA